MHFDKTSAWGCDVENDEDQEEDDDHDDEYEY